MKNLNIAGVVSALIILTGCAGRSPDPVAIAQVGDGRITCEQMTSEIANNKSKMSDLSQEENLKRGQNVAAGVAGAMLIVPLLAMDFQDAAGEEKTALEHRNQHLSSLYVHRCNENVQKTFSGDGQVSHIDTLQR